MKFRSILIAVTLFSTPAFADEAANKIAGIKCSEAKEMVKLMAKMDKMKPDQTDSVAANPEMTLTPKSGVELPQRLFFRDDDGETEFNLAKDGRVTDFGKIGTLNKDGEMCIQDKNRIGKAVEEDSMSVNMEFHIEYKNKSGTHSLAELQDGLKDGRDHVKKIVPAPVRLILPKFTHVVIGYDAEEEDEIHTSPQIVALQGDVKLEGLVVESLERAHYVSIKHLEEIGADNLGVYGGKYRMEPTPGPEKMKKIIEKRKKAEKEN